jgi:DDB1- and CUL4-associated factor 13
MEHELRANSWAVVFLHERFKDVIKFKVWDAVERLDETEELKDQWRDHEHMVFKSKPPRAVDIAGDIFTAGDEPVANVTSIVPRSPPGATVSASTYDKPSVALSDLVRFVLCHRFGGIYLDVDTLFLRDWEELWGWQGAFAYRWSRMDRYNTAVLRMHQGSAFGTFTLRTALKNGLNFHPIRISSYLKDAQMEGLLMKVPDALFDPAWLMTEGYQLERPPQPLLNSYVGRWRHATLAS